MGRKNWKASGYDPVTKKRINLAWSDERLRQVQREAYYYGEELKKEKEEKEENRKEQ